MDYHPISSINEKTPIEFVIWGSGQDYIDLANSQLYVKLNVRKADNTPIIAASKVGPVNLLQHSLFGEVDIKLIDVLITSTNNTYAYRACLETLLSYSAEAKTTQLAASLCCNDDANKMDDANLTVSAANDGLRKRHAYISEGKAIDLLVRIHADLFYQQKYLTNDVTIRIRLIS